MSERALPAWFWLLPLCAALAWWPVGSYWASDDFLALHYANDLGRVAHDFVGPQYGATDVWWFYRPLITLSFWFDQQLGGVDPFVSHLSNVLAHALSALLVGLLWRRHAPVLAAWLAALCWAIAPGHVGSIAWAVGRVDSHTTVWCLLALWLTQRALDAGPGARRRLAIVLATAAALMSKELAFVVPPLASWLAFVAGPGPLRERARRAWTVTWPVWLLLLLYVPFRIAVLGRFGGYEAAALDQLRPGAVLAGLGRVLLDTAAPVRWIGSPTGEPPAAVFVWACGAPAAVAALLALVRRPAASAALLVAFGVALVPMVAFLPAADNPHNLRYYYLPTALLFGLIALAGRWLGLAVLLAWLWPLVAVRVAQHDADRDSAARHEALLQVATDAPAGPLFVAGLPHQNRAGTALQLHYGVDRMLQPPFAASGRRLFAWRPMLQRPDAVRLTAAGAPPFPLPSGATLHFADPRTLVAAPDPTAPPLPELVIEGDVDGVFDLTTPRLEPLIAQFADVVARDVDTFGLTTPGVRPPAYRVTMFTANGYLSCLCLDHARPGAAAGRIDAVRFFAGNGKHAPPPEWIPPATLAGLDGPYVGDALVVPTTIDLVPEFPTLIEAGRVDVATMSFTPTHRARRLLSFRFDRDYPAWARRAQGRE